MTTLPLPPSDLLVLGTAEHCEQVWRHQGNSEGPRVIDLTPLGRTAAERAANGKIAFDRAGSRRQGNAFEVLPDGVVRITVVTNADQVSRVVFDSIRQIRQQLKEEGLYNIELRSLQSDMTRLLDAVRAQPVGRSATGQLAIRTDPTARYEVEFAEDARGLSGLVMRRVGASFEASMAAGADDAEAANTADLAVAVRTQSTELHELRDAVNVLGSGLQALLLRLGDIESEKPARAKKATKAESVEQAA